MSQTASNFANTAKLNAILDQMTSLSFRTNNDVSDDTTTSFSQRSELVENYNVLNVQNLINLVLKRRLATCLTNKMKVLFSHFLLLLTTMFLLLHY